MTRAILLLLLMAVPGVAQLPQLPPSPAPYVTNMTFTTNEGVSTSYDFPLNPPFTSLPVVKHTPKHLEFLQSLGTPMKRVAKTTATKQMFTGAAQPQPQFLTLVWDYPFDQIPLVAFQIYHATTLTNWPPLTRFDQIPSGFTMLSEVTGATSYQIQPYLAAEFFLVRARDLDSGAVGPWNTGSNYTYVLPATLPPGVYIGPTNPK